VQVECNGEAFVDWTGDPQLLSFGPNSGPEDRLRISSGNTRCLYTEQVLVRLK